MKESLYKIYGEMGISRELADRSGKVLDTLKERFAAIDETAEYNQLKVLKAMQEARVSEGCLHGTTGYGYELSDNPLCGGST